MQSLMMGLVAYWPLNEADGARKSVAGGWALTDNAGVGRGDGLLGNAADFVSANSEYLSLTANLAAFAITAATDQMTWVAWVYPTGTLPGRGILAKGIENTAAGLEYYLLIDTTLARFRIRASNGTTVATHTHTDTLPAVNQWFFIAGGWENGNLWSQVNQGKQVSSSLSLVQNTNSEFRVGGGPGEVAVTLPWQGRIFGVGVWRRTLTPGELSYLYNRGLARLAPFSPAVRTPDRARNRRALAAGLGLV